jgi:hypothetical protein
MYLKAWLFLGGIIWLSCTEYMLCHVKDAWTVKRQTTMTKTKWTLMQSQVKMHTLSSIYYEMNNLCWLITLIGWYGLIA